MIARNEALELLEKENLTPALIRHSLAAEAVMTALAKYFGEDAVIWGLTGLLHDLDYPATENNPQRHGLETVQKLSDKLPNDALQAIKAHNGEHNGEKPQIRFDYALRCGETVTGLIAAAALMRPTGYEGMQVKSIRKKMKDKAFAASVSRENIMECENAGIALEQFLQLAIDAMTNLDKEEKSSSSNAE